MWIKAPLSGTSEAYSVMPILAVEMEAAEVGQPDNASSGADSRMATDLPAAPALL
jgi:hypothetical protein